ncbi:DUF1801 domain-containing protein [Lacihabitans sp. LS3-19]|uniref:DUF1801 domain-containing protein n=1 Tax=Lacihabitans sp. LS3-19 TaxID=2487335 RepID=UPI0020CC9681|nr:DUF1801 domain-containing protein [Lacihabitans sp. LS3-19]MCP9770955.1 DUF1801 domain-containing protein [Lacihabitans sp. LS3-19]
MAKANLKTTENEASVSDFLNKIENETRKKDCFTVSKFMEEITHLPPKMWGPAIVGFGSYHYKYDSGREGDMLKVGFSPRKEALTLYIGANAEENKELLEKLGKYKTGKGCLYIKSLDDVDHKILKELISNGFKRENPC